MSFSYHARRTGKILAAKIRLKDHITSTYQTHLTPAAL
ncbi:hypothetical protein VPUCM_0604 [Vibrio parahaemolyticus UCM-V493]|nr:hypothetical protein VPUCM_0604 [Vibrio parahaemolyticus UCM-V493]